jgi:hypothetical protein
MARNLDCAVDAKQAAKISNKFRLSVTSAIPENAEVVGQDPAGRFAAVRGQSRWEMAQSDNADQYRPSAGPQSG